MKRLLSLLAPFLAVTLFWCVGGNAWPAILAYHVQILFWRWTDLRRLRWMRPDKGLLFALPTALAGPLLYFLLPVMTRGGLASWLAVHRLTGSSLLLMIPYFGLVHPLLEQLHWRPLREETAWAHPLFAAYHVLVLYALLPLPWLLLCFATLLAASLAWRQLTRLTRNLAPATASHALADLGIVLAVWLRTRT